MKKKEENQSLSVEGIVSRRDTMPYIKLFHNSAPIAQLSMAQARNFAGDILTMCARTEADAMIHQFFDKSEFPPGAAAELMMDFRVFRHSLDSEQVERTVHTPSGDPKPQ